MDEVNTELLQNALKTLESGKDSDAVEELKTEIEAALEKVEGSPNAEVESAVVFSSQEKKRLESSLNALFKRKMLVTYRTNKEILGGFRVFVGDWKFDATLSSQVDTMRSILKRS